MPVKKKRKKVKKQARTKPKRVGKTRAKKRKAAGRRKTRRAVSGNRSGGARGEIAKPELRGRGLSAAGQAGDTQELPRSETVDSESVEELLEEGQSFEAEAIRGVENALDPDEGEVVTHEFPEDDVPGEYLETESNFEEKPGAKKKSARK